MRRTCTRGVEDRTFFFLVNSQRGLKLMEQKCGVADSDVLLVITCGVPVVTSGIPVVFQW